jgi:hypothetical protein
MVHASESLVNEWEAGRRRITDAFKPILARKLDDGQLYMAMTRDATGGPCAAPWLDGIDDHRLACALKTIEELEEAMAAIKGILPVLVRQPDRVTEADRQLIADTMLELIESTTAGENTCARLARIYGVSLAELWDRHQAELTEKGYLKEKTAPGRAGM